ncbi:MAG TPA: prenyltransferase/squalene oxidase repeat-containing protein [Pirellulales bacterium]|nr:prenyltransferase/squalene oxidase repeat-containing protein [Pirellulales bacterium]
MASPDPGVHEGADAHRSLGNANPASATARQGVGIIDRMDAAKEAGFDSYYRWLGIPQAEQPPTLYRLLGLSPLEPDLGVIEEAADRQMAHVRAHQNGPYSAESQRLLNELSAAKLTLLHVAKKLAYDRTLRPPVPPPPLPGPARIAPAASAPAPRPIPMPPPAPVAVAPIPIAAAPGSSGAGFPAPEAYQPPAEYQGANAPRSPANPTRMPGNGAAARAPERAPPQPAPMPSPVMPRPVPVAVRGDPSKLVLRDAPVDPDDELKQFALKKAPPWAVSCIVHMLALIILGLWYITPEGDNKGIFLDVAAPEVGEQLMSDSLELPAADQNLDETIVTPADLSQVEDPFAEPADEKPEIDLLGSKPVVKLDVPKIEIALLGREPGTKETLLAKYGGNGTTEDSVGRALAWLAKQQRKDGSWSLRGPYKSGALGRDVPESATAMALLAFQGNGHTHQRGEYRQNVAKGIKALLRMQQGNGDFFEEGGTSNNWFYAHAQATMAVCELYGMTKDLKLRDPAVKAIQFLIESQDPELGGWRYMPRSDSDTSVTGWVVMAFQTARMAGLEVPSPVLAKIGEYLDKVSEDGSTYGYQVGTEPSWTMTAEALLCRQYLGWRRDDERLVSGAEQVLKYLPRYEDRDVYYWYYGTQMMHHMDGKFWQTWNGALRDMLVENQESDGSWDPGGKHPDKWANLGQGGRLYTTCLSVYMLEVYYRHLPIYGVGK